MRHDVQSAFERLLRVLDAWSIPYARQGHRLALVTGQPTYGHPWRLVEVDGDGRGESVVANLGTSSASAVRALDMIIIGIDWCARARKEAP